MMKKRINIFILVFSLLVLIGFAQEINDVIAGGGGGGSSNYNIYPGSNVVGGVSE